MPVKLRRFVLDSDGAFEVALIPVLRWIIEQLHPELLFTLEFVDGRQVRSKSRRLEDRLARTLRLQPVCDLAFVHRDAEKASYAKREEEIYTAAASLRLGMPPPAIVPVVPVTMVEAWLLFDEKAIRQAAGNPNGKAKLALPKLSAIEEIKQPKDLLYELLQQAGHSESRRRHADPAKQAHLVCQFIDDFSPLTRLPAFSRLVERTREALTSI